MLKVHQIFSNRLLERAPFCPRLIVTLFVSIFLCLGQSSTAMSGQLSWIEICGEDGPEMVQVDEEQSVPSECTHCSACLFLGSDVQGMAPSPSLLPFPTRIYSNKINLPQGVQISFFGAGPNSRAPPVKGFSFMTTPNASRTREYAGAVLV